MSPTPPSTPSSSEEDSSEEGEDRYGRPIRRTLGGYASVSDDSGSSYSGDGAWDPVPDADLNTFAAHFRALVEQVARETSEAAVTAEPDHQPPSPGRGPNDSHFVLGRVIHRMPTIESMGSREVTSLASFPAGVSRPSTRANTLSNADAPNSRSASRANSLDAAMSLSISIELANELANERATSEFGELTPSSTTSFSAPFALSTSAGGSKSTTSYHTAASTHAETSVEGER